ncbi:hypothetical protein VOLCADRAFT_103418 [Volvox carteri f. nagariensis]|uniref:SRCR domain-containing protein n=1 Tax=Volvox carteri f. nagariensis TaxID=3068 RepID=D8TLR2_VOLCA|nr:uncharacterized protein VOLCADRAFT_103418 [Volvox carteri f. nagariensis]EFJ51375.1 hypothetical protein VOLCADRAFT_103418 [Volvox carteri f. nagariensis]|eukprot:XP_002947327.1 hypothetical protein VOLCADRAFT_103418 [Volvox carteri f. nagariensis]
MGSLTMRAALVALLVIIATSGGDAQLRNYRSKNGVRLAGGSGPKGRLELSSVDAWFSNSSAPTKPAWNAVCDEDVDEDVALIMCQMLGYSYGRKAYDARFSYRKPPTSTARIGRITCDQKDSSRRALRGLPTQTTATKNAGGAADQPLLEVNVGSASDAHDPRVDRSLYTPRMATLRSPPSAPYTCMFGMGRCDTQGPLAGLECSHTPLGDASPPPPSPPSPPPAPPQHSSFIKLVGGRPADQPWNKVESNLACISDYYPCTNFGRVEALVDSLNGDGTMTWAPVCAIDDPDLADRVRSVICQQIVDWMPNRDGMSLTVNADVSFEVPLDPVTSSSDFDPNKYDTWFTVLGYDGALARLQDFMYMASQTPCESLLGVQCQVFRHPLDMVKQAFEFPTQPQQVWVSPLMQLQAPPLQDIRPEWMLQPWVSDVGGGDCNSHDDSKGRLKVQTFSA